MESRRSRSFDRVVCRVVADAGLRAHPPQGLLRQGLRVPVSGKTEEALNGRARGKARASSRPTVGAVADEFTVGGLLAGAVAGANWLAAYAGLDFGAVVAFEVGVATVHRKLTLGNGAGGFGGGGGQAFAGGGAGFGFFLRGGGGEEKPEFRLARQAAGRVAGVAGEPSEGGGERGRGHGVVNGRANGAAGVVQ